MTNHALQRLWSFPITHASQDATINPWPEIPEVWHISTQSLDLSADPTAMGQGDGVSGTLVEVGVQDEYDGMGPS